MEIYRNYKPEIPYDAGQAYLEFYRPAVHIMRTAKSKNLLTNAQLLFQGIKRFRRTL